MSKGGKNLKWAESLKEKGKTANRKENGKRSA
jgi:hypothetical protein